MPDIFFIVVGSTSMGSTTSTTASAGAGSASLAFFALTSTSGASAAHFALASSLKAFQSAAKALPIRTCFSLPPMPSFPFSTRAFAAARCSLSK